MAVKGGNERKGEELIETPKGIMDRKFLTENQMSNA